MYIPKCGSYGEHGTNGREGLMYFEYLLWCGVESISFDSSIVHTILQYSRVQYSGVKYSREQ